VVLFVAKRFDSWTARAVGACIFGFGCLACLDCCGSMFGWTSTLVTAFPVAIVATIREWLDLGGDVDCSLVSVDLEVQE
jgi:hypothetical protein